MRVPRLAAGFAVALLLCGLPADAEAEPVRIGLVIEVAAVFGNLREVFGSDIAVGDVVRGTFTYDPNTPDGLPGPTEGAYSSTGTVSFATGTPLTLPLRDIRVYEQSANPPPFSDDSIDVLASTELFPGYYQVSAGLSLSGPGQNGDRLPATAAELLAGFGGAGVFLFSANKIGGNPPNDSGTHELSGTVQLVPAESQPVPEPSTLLLFGAGAATILRRHRLSRGVR